MLLERLFNLHQSEKSSMRSASDVAAGAPVSLANLYENIYATFLNDYVAHVFDEVEGDRASQAHFYGKALEISTALSILGYQGNLTLQASDIAENQRQRARRRYHEIRSLAESVLVDQRNYLLATLINARASSVGCAAQGRPYSGMETESGQPCHAFALKLLADAALKRGFALGLTDEAVTMLEHQIALRAEKDIQHFLLVFEDEEGELP